MIETIVNGALELLKELFSLWGEMLKAFFELLPKIVSFLLWVLAGVIIIPCALISHHYYGKWTEWGEKNF